MTEFDSFDHFIRKRYEVYRLYFKHYLPQGKPLPNYYRDVFYEDFKLWESGALEELNKEPMVQETVEQLGLFKPLPKRSLFDMTKRPVYLNGPLIDKDKPKEKP